jgi:hypothetical protein
MNFWSIVKTISFAAIIFAAGSVVGGVATIRFVERRVRERLDDRNWTNLTMNWLDRELSLSDAQLAQIEPIVMGGTGELKEIRDETELRRRAILAAKLKEVRKHLTPDQEAKLPGAIERVRRQIRYVGAPFR